MKAFTLVEMMVSSVIFGALFLALLGVFTFGNSAYQRDVSLLELQQNARNGMDRLLREVRESRASVITSVSAQNDRISFQTPTRTGVQYYVNNGQLIREYPAGTPHVIAGQISGATFSKNGKLLTIGLLAQRTYGEGVFSFPLRKTVRLRNE